MKLYLTAALLALAACPSKNTAPTVSNTGPTDEPRAAEPGMTDGALWTCQISDYDPQPCKLAKADGGWKLTKLLGSQRFDGTIAWPDPDTADFAGKFFCPWGACDEEMNVTFKRDVAAFTTDFGGDTISVRYDEGLAGEWGGAGYGSLTGYEQ